MALSGPPGGSTGPPAGLVEGVGALGARIAAASAAVGTTVELDGLALLGERAALDGLGRGGATSCRGATRLLPAADGWVAVSLARPWDIEALPAWLGTEPVAPGPTPTDPWDAVAAAVATRGRADLVERAALLGLPVGALGERAADPDGGVARTVVGAARPRRDGRVLRVLDLSGLWAGPLCASLLGLAGAEVVKVESTTRPDGSRTGNPGLFRLLHGGARSVALDLTTGAGRRHLARLVGAADVVVESSRPRALEQMGIVAVEALADDDGPRAWVSITGHGRAHGRVALGDDAAVAGGLVLEAEGRPWFCADAVADPLTGLAAAAAALEALAGGDVALLDVAMAGVAASLAGPTLPAVPAPDEVAPPRARSPRGPLAPFGADTAPVLAEWQ